MLGVPSYRHVIQSYFDIPHVHVVLLKKQQPIIMAERWPTKAPFTAAASLSHCLPPLPGHPHYDLHALFFFALRLPVRPDTQEPESEDNTKGHSSPISGGPSACTPIRFSGAHPQSPLIEMNFLKVESNVNRRFLGYVGVPPTGQVVFDGWNAAHILMPGPCWPRSLRGPLVLSLTDVCFQ